MWQPTNARATALREAVEKCPLSDRQSVPVDGVCPRDAGKLLILDDILTASLQLASRIFKAWPILTTSRLSEASELHNELVFRYLKGQRIYRWQHWLTDSTGADWTKYVFFRMVGGLKLGVMASIAHEELKRESIKPPSTSTTGLSDDEDSVEMLVKILNVEANVSPDSTDEAVFESAVPECRALIHLAIEECAFKKGFHRHSAKSLGIYKDIYETNPPRTTNMIAKKWGVPRYFVAWMRTPDRLITRLQARDGRTLDRICDVISEKLSAQSHGLWGVATHNHQTATGHRKPREAPLCPPPLES